MKMEQELWRKQWKNFGFEAEVHWIWNLGKNLGFGWENGWYRVESWNHFSFDVWGYFLVFEIELLWKESWILTENWASFEQNTKRTSFKLEWLAWSRGEGISTLLCLFLLSSINILVLLMMKMNYFALAMWMCMYMYMKPLIYGICLDESICECEICVAWKVIC